MKLSPDQLRSVAPQPWLPGELQAGKPEPEIPVDALLAALGESIGVSPTCSVNPGAKRIASQQPWIPPQLGGVSVQGMLTSMHPQAAALGGQPADPLRAVKKEAADLVDNARQEAETILAQAQVQAAEIETKAYEEGRKRAETEAETAVQTAHSIVEQVANWRDEMLAQSEAAVLGLVKEISQKIFGEGFALDPQVLQATFSRVLENARSMGDLTIYIHPLDAARLDPYWREFQTSVSGHQIQVIPSEAIRRGGCFVDGQWGTVDARIETQLKAIMGALTPSSEDEGGQV